MDTGSIIFQWLERIGLGYATPKLKTYGVNAPDDLMRLTEADFPKLDVTEATDVKRLSELISRVRQAHANNLERKPRRPEQQQPGGTSGAERESRAEVPSGAEGAAYSRAPPTQAGEGRRLPAPPRLASEQSAADAVPVAVISLQPPSSTNVSGTRARSGVDRDGFEVRRAAPKQPPVEGRRESPSPVEDEAAAAVAAANAGKRPRPSLGVGVMPSQRALLNKQLQLQLKEAGGGGGAGSTSGGDAAASAAAKRKSMGGALLTPAPGGSSSSSNAKAALPPTGAFAQQPQPALSQQQGLATPSALAARRAGPSGGSSSNVLKPQHPGLSGGARNGISRPGSAPFSSPPQSQSAAPHSSAPSSSSASAAAGIGGGASRPRTAALGRPVEQHGDDDDEYGGDDDDGNVYSIADDEGHVDDELDESSPHSAPSLEHRRAVHRQLGSSGILEEDGGGAKIKVVVRKRPLNKRERVATARGDDMDVVQMVSRGALLVHEPKVKVDLTKYTETHEFTFDEVFDETVTTEDVYRYTARPLISHIFRGQNATCFAYGQTGSGKTYTMMGNVRDLAGATPDEAVGERADTQPGLYVLAARDIFARLAFEESLRPQATVPPGAHERPGVEHRVVVCSFFEIYGGRLFDLMTGRSELKALVDHRGEVQIIGLSEQRVPSVEALLRAIDTGNRARSTGSTGANEDSSRSHAVLAISLAHAVSDGAGGLILRVDPVSKRTLTAGKFSFIDLAGSERGADTTHNDRRRRLEGAEINKSLLALKECIRSLYQEADYNPFRGSKLTQVLKDSFVGDSRSVMVATISPSQSNCEHSLNTLRYAYRVKEIRPDAVIGPPMDDDTAAGGGAASDFGAAAAAVGGVRVDPPHGKGSEFRPLPPAAFLAVQKRGGGAAVLAQGGLGGALPTSTSAAAGGGQQRRAAPPPTSTSVHVEGRQLPSPVNVPHHHASRDHSSSPPEGDFAVNGRSGFEEEEGAAAAAERDAEADALQQQRGSGADSDEQQQQQHLRPQPQPPHAKGGRLPGSHSSSGGGNSDTAVGSPHSSAAMSGGVMPSQRLAAAARLSLGNNASSSSASTGPPTAAAASGVPLDSARKRAVAQVNAQFFKALTSLPMNASQHGALSDDPNAPTASTTGAAAAAAAAAGARNTTGGPGRPPSVTSTSAALSSGIPKPSSVNSSSGGGGGSMPPPNSISAARTATAAAAQIAISTSSRPTTSTSSALPPGTPLSSGPHLQLPIATGSRLVPPRSVIPSARQAAAVAAVATAKQQPLLPGATAAAAPPALPRQTQQPAIVPIPVTTGASAATYASPERTAVAAAAQELAVTEAATSSSSPSPRRPGPSTSTSSDASSPPHRPPRAAAGGVTAPTSAWPQFPALVSSPPASQGPSPSSPVRSFSRTDAAAAAPLSQASPVSTPHAATAAARSRYDAAAPGSAGSAASEFYSPQVPPIYYEQHAGGPPPPRGAHETSTWDGTGEDGGATASSNSAGAAALNAAIEEASTEGATAVATDSYNNDHGVHDDDDDDDAASIPPPPPPPSLTLKLGSPPAAAQASGARLHGSPTRAVAAVSSGDAYSPSRGSDRRPDPTGTTEDEGGGGVVDNYHHLALTGTESPARAAALMRSHRIRAASARLSGAPLNARERHLVAIHREATIEERALLVDELRLLSGTGLSSPAAKQALNSPSSANGGSLTRGDMARYAIALEDTINRKLLLISDLMRLLEEYRAEYGAEVGLLPSTAADPLSLSYSAAAAAGREGTSTSVGGEGGSFSFGVLDDSLMEGPPATSSSLTTAPPLAATEVEVGEEALDGDLEGYDFNDDDAHDLDRDGGGVDAEEELPWPESAAAATAIGGSNSAAAAHYRNGADDSSGGGVSDEDYSSDAGGLIYVPQNRL